MKVEISEAMQNGQNRKINYFNLTGKIMAQFFEPSTDTNANFANSVSGQTNSFFLPSVYSKKVLKLF